MADRPGDPAAGQEAACVFPVSHAQQRLWFLEELEGPGAAYNVRLPVRLRGALDVDCLGRALERVVARHESLRTTFGTRGAEPVQLVAPRLSVPLDCVALPEAGEAELRDYLGRLAARPFDLRRGPLLRAHLVRRSATEHVLLLVSHHIISDAWSSGVLFRDLACAYAALHAGREPDWPELPIQYADFAAWQREWLQCPALQDQAGFWQQHLAGAPALLDLPLDRPRPALQGYRGSRLSHQLEPSLAAALGARAGAEGVTLFMLLFAAFNLLLARWSGQQDLVIGTPIAGRRRSELEGLIGFFANTLALRTRVDPAASFRALLAQVRATALAAFDHQDLPFEKLVELLNPPRDLRHAPVFQVMFILQNTPWEADALGGLQAEPAEIAPGDTSRFDLTLSVAAYEGSLWLGLEYNTDLFDGDTMARLAASYEVLLRAILADPGAPQASLPLLSPAERRRVLEDFNATAVPGDVEGGVYARVAARVAMHPGATAVEWMGGSLSYAQLDAAVARFAGQLQAAGAGPGQPVALLLPRDGAMLVALLAALRMGAPYLPLDPAHPPARLGFILEDAGATLLVAPPEAGAALPGFAGARIPPPVLYAPAGAAPPVPAPAWSANAPAYLIYTSGSTGQPKGVVVPHGAVLNFLDSMAREPGLSPGERLLAVTTLAFDIALLELLLPLVTGGTTVIASRDEVEDPVRLAARLRDSHIQVLQATPSLWRLLLASGWAGQPGLRALAGGEALDEALAAALQPRVAELWNLYGPTETTIWSTAGRVLEGPVTVGRPIANTRCYVLDEAGVPTPVGVPGELWIGGRGVALGYHRRPELTAERFSADPLAGEAGARRYRTGDRARWLADGRLQILGRLDGQLKLRGHRLEPGEVEAVLATHPGVAAAAVDLRTLAGDPRLVAWVVPAAIPPPPGELAAHLRERLPAYMVPAHWEFVAALPRTPNGKLDRRGLPDPALAPVPAPARAPTPREAALAACFAQVLGLPAVDPEADFFALGGHSLLATRLVALIRLELGVDLPLKALFQSPTVAGLAARLPEALAPPLPPVPAPRQRAPASLVQQRLWFLHRLEPGSTVYHLAWAFRLAGRPDPARLQAALDALVARHHVLRTRFTEEEGEPWQVVEPAPGVRLRTGACGPGVLQELVDGPFNLTRGPLLRVALLDAEEGAAVLAVVIHHIVADGWSLGIFLRELAAFYADGAGADLPPLPLQYAQYAAAQREQLAGPALAAALDYWRTQLAHLPPVLALPTDRARPPLPTHRGARLGTGLPPATVAALRVLGQREGATLFMVLLAGFAVVLGRYAGTEDVAVGTPVAGRPRTELEGLIGFFVNTLVLRTDLGGNPGFRTLLGRVKAMALAAYAHAELPFEKLVEVLNPPRSPSRTPLFQVLFNLHNEPAPVLALGGLVLEPMPVERHTSKFDLSVSLAETRDGLAVGCEYSTDLFDRETVAGLMRDFMQVLETVAAEPELRLAELCRGPAPRDAGAVTVGTGAPGGDLLPAFLAQVQQQPGALAVSAMGSGGAPGLRWTYDELAAEARRLAGALVSAGVAPGDRVGLWFGHGAGQVAGMLGALWAGATYVPLDPRAPDARLAQVARDAGLAVVLAEEPTGTWLHHGGLRVVDVRSAGNLAPPAPVADPEALAYLLYTSGSTGTPKGVPQPRGHVRAQVGAWAGNLGLSPADRLSLVSTYGYDAAAQDIFGALLTGASVHPLDVRAWDREALLDRIAGSALTVLHATPTVYRYLFGGHVACRQDLSAVRLVVLGGEVARRADLDLFKSRFRRGARLVNGYGLTEATAVLQWFADHDTRVLGSTLPVGRPVGAQQVWLADEAGNTAGVQGELVLESATVTPGYWQPGAARAAAPGRARAGVPRRWRTGDLARYLPDGNLLWVGRRDRQFKVAGVRLEAGDIEAALAEAVQEVAVQVVEAEPGWPEIVAVYAPAEVPEAQLRDRARTRLPEALRPARYLGLAALPRRPNGKLDLAALDRLVLEQAGPLPSPATASAVPEAATGSDALEATLQALWGELLRRPAPIGLDEDFFALGGHSLLATRLIARLRDRLQVELPLLRIFETPTIRGLAAALRQLQASPARPAAGAIPRQRR